MAAHTPPRGSVPAYVDALPPVSCDVSVLIVAWNARDYLERLIPNLLDLQDRTAFEIVVVDNGSVDGSADYLDSVSDSLRVIRLDHNSGFSRGNNIGIRECSGRYVLLLNADTIVTAGMLDEMVAVMDRDASIGVTGARHVFPDGSLQWSTDDFPTLLNDFLHFTDLYRLPVLQGWLARRYPRWRAHDEETDVDWVNGACFLISREALRRVGGLDEHFFIYAEELDFCLRVWRSGLRVRFVPTAVVIHALGGTFRKPNTNRRVMLYQSSVRYYTKNKSLPELVALRAVFGANASARLVLCAFAGSYEVITQRRIPEGLRTLLTQDDVRAPWGETLRAWAKIPIVRAADPLRP
jgi:GT2 family glycosyltransferase